MAYASTRGFGLGAEASAGASLATPGLPTVAWAPPQVRFNAADYQPQTFAQAQFAKWSHSSMQADIEKGRAQLSAKLGVTLPKLPAMGQSEVTSWTAAYALAHGVPTNFEDGAKMVTAFAHAQAAKLGVPPEWIAAADVLMHPPTTTAEATALVADVGKAYFAKYGIALLQNELMSVSTNLAMVTQAIPVEFAVAGFDALKDGKLTGEEIAGIAVQAAAYACGMLLQGIGIPAPLGALIGGVIAGQLSAVADNVIHADDADTRARKAAYAALDKQREALMTECASAAQETWNKTQEYWDQVLGRIQALLDVPAIAARIRAAGGIRYYGRNVVQLPAGVVLPETSSVVAKRFREPGDWEAWAKQAEADAKAAEAIAKKHYGSRDAGPYIAKAGAARKRATDLAKKAAEQPRLPLYEYGFDCLWWEGQLDHRQGQPVLPRNARPFPDGCLYYGRVRPTGVWVGSEQKLDPAQWMQGPYWVDPSRVWERCAARSSMRWYPSFRAGDTDESCSAAMKVAAEFRFDFTPDYETRKMNVRLTPYTDHQSAVRTKIVTITRGALVDGAPNAQAALQFWGAKRPTSPVLYSDGSDASQWKQFAYIDPGAMEVHKVAGSLTAKLNLPFDYCDVNQWMAAVQTAAAASALVEQDIVRTVAWQAGAEEARRVAADWQKLAALTPDQQQQLVAYAKAAQTEKENWAKLAALTPEQQRQLVAYAAQQAEQRRQLLAYAAALKAKQQSDMIAARANRALLQAKALGAARAASGAYAVALKARLGYQAAQMSQRTTLLLGGLAIGAFLLWKVATGSKRARPKT